MKVLDILDPDMPRVSKSDLKGMKTKDRKKIERMTYRKNM